jgi:hypothetical protein
MAGLDLTGVAEFLETEILVDQLRFDRDNGSADDTLDEDGDIVEAAASLLYAGPGAVQPLDGFSEVQDPDVQRILRTTEAKYRAMIPLAAGVEFKPGDLCRVTEQGGVMPNPLMLARRFEVVELAQVATLGVVQVVYLKQSSVAAGG